jgi:hypothetical protein
MFPAEVQAKISFMRDNAITGQRPKRGSVRTPSSVEKPGRVLPPRMAGQFLMRLGEPTVG